MSLIQNGLHKFHDGAGVLTLRAEADTSLRVVRVKAVDPAVALGYLEPTIDRKVVGYLRISDHGAASDILMTESVAAGPPIALTPDMCVNIFDQLKARGIALTYPVATGQTFRIPSLGGVGIDVEYDLFDAGDVLATEVNGTDSNEFYYIERGTNGVLVAAGLLSHRIVTSITPGEFPDFPFGGPAGAKSSFDIYGIIAQPCAEGGGAALIGCTERLHLIHERETLLDPDRVGLLFRGDVSHIALSVVYTRIECLLGHNKYPSDLPLYFDPPLHFEPGAELVVEVTFALAVAGAGLTAGTLDVGFILKETRG